MELHHLRCAIVLAEQENFTRAALALHMKQPSLSYVINRLEADLGAKLFDRLPRRVVATPVGRAFLEQARASLLYADAARAVVAQSTGIIAGDLRIVSTSLTTMELSDSLTAFHVCHPSVRFLVHEPAGREEVVKQVRDGRCELGVIRSTELPEGLVSKVLAYQEQVAVFADKLIPAPAADPISLTSLGRYPLVAPPSGTVERERFNNTFADHHLSPRIVAECADHETRLELARGGVGVVLVSRRRLGSADCRDLRLLTLDPPIRVAIALIRRAAELTPTAAAFWDQTAPDLRVPSSGIVAPLS